MWIVPTTFFLDLLNNMLFLVGILFVNSNFALKLTMCSFENFNLKIQCLVPLLRCQMTFLSPCTVFCTELYSSWNFRCCVTLFTYRSWDYICFLHFLVFFSMGGAQFILSFMEIVNSLDVFKVRNVFEKEDHCSLSLYFALWSSLGWLIEILQLLNCLLNQ